MIELLKRLSKTIVSRAGPYSTHDPETGMVVEQHLEKGVLHCTDGKPALIWRDPETNLVTREEYYEHGVLHRTGGKPALIWRDPETNVVIDEKYYENGRYHRIKGCPAVICRDPKTGDVTYESFYEDGKAVALEREIKQTPKRAVLTPL